MGKFDGILLCTDLDGTLYRNDKTVSEENKEAIEYFKREGGYFTFITGRLPYYSQDAYRAASPNVPFGCVNGGGVYDGEAHRYVWTRETPVHVMELVECIDKHFPDVGIQVCAFDKTYFAKENETMMHFRRVTGLPNLVCAYREMKEPIAKIIFGTSKEDEIRAVEKMLKSHPLAGQFDFVRSERSLYEILPRNTHKGVALQKLIEYLRVDPAKTVAVGDYYNDIGMFRAAALGVAVANACDEAKEAADAVTVCNEEHALAQVIYDLERGKLVLN